MSSTSYPRTIDDLKHLVSQILDPTIVDYVNGGSGREATLRGNLASFSFYHLKGKIFSVQETPSSITEIQGRSIELPICIAPTAFHKLAHENGEAATFRAAKKSGTIYVISCLSTTGLGTLKSEGGMEHVWVQLLTFKNRNIMQEIVKSAEQLGCGAIVLTVDAPVSGNRKKDTVNRFQLPEGLRMQILHDHLLDDSGRNVDGSMLDSFFEDHIDPRFGWEDLRDLIRETKLPVILKGVLCPDDAEKALEYGVKGIIVSNHGGRQLDDAVPSLFALERIARRIRGRVELYVDGGFRTGTDVFKALALGAKAVFLGRPVLWGLAHDGEEGVNNVLHIFKRDLIHTMHLCGVSKVSEINTEYLWEKQ